MNTTLLAPTAPAAPAPAPDIQTIKTRHKATWESGDFGEVAKYIVGEATEFMSHLDLQPGMKVLDAACGTGNLAVIAAKRGCITSGLDLAGNLIAGARERARKEGLSIEYTQGDAEALPYADATFDAVVSMYGVMFAPRPELIVSELRRVTKPGGLIALANWSPDGFIGKMFQVFSRHITPPAGIPSPLMWGDEAVVRARFNRPTEQLKLTHRTARMRFPFNPEGTVDFFRRYYGPTLRAFDSLKGQAQDALRRDLIELQTKYNVAKNPNETDNPADYLEVQVRLAA